MLKNFFFQQQIVRDYECCSVIKESQFTYYYTEDMRGLKIWFASCWSGSIRRGPRQTGRLGILMNRVAFPERMIYVIFG